MPTNIFPRFRVHQHLTRASVISSTLNGHSSAADTPVQNGRVLVFIVAYEAEKHVASVFERIPKQLYNNDRLHFLLIDDASSDAGINVAREWVEKNGVENCKLLR